MPTEPCDGESGDDPNEFDLVHRVHVGADAERPSAAVVEAIARATGRPPAPGVLYEAIDPDALDALFADRPDGTERSDGVVSFGVDDCVVTIHADGEIVAMALD